MIVLNFSHPLTFEQTVQIEALTKEKVEQVIEITVQFDNEGPFEPQLQELMTKLPLTSEELQTRPILVNLPSLNTIAALLLAELHGQMGYFPPVIRLRPTVVNMITQFEVIEILNLQALRDGARKGR
jgi:hypothetical protein